MIIRRLKQALVLLLLIISSAAAHAENDTLPVSLLPNIVDLDSGARAAFAASGSRLIVFDRQGSYVWDVTAKRSFARSPMRPMPTPTC